MGELVGEVSVCGYACVCGVGVVRACVDVRVSVCVRLGLHAIQHATYAVLPKEGVVCVQHEHVRWSSASSPARAPRHCAVVNHTDSLNTDTHTHLRARVHTHRRDRYHTHNLTLTRFAHIS